MSIFENDLQRLTFLKRTIALLSSMVDDGERHSTRTREMKDNAQQVILEMEANKSETSEKQCNLPVVSSSALKPIRQHLGGIFSNWYCPKCKKDITGKGYKKSCGECGQLLKW